MCIVLYVKLIRCSGIQGMYDQLTEGPICHAYMCFVQYLLEPDKFGVVAFKASMLDWLGVHLSLVYMCKLLYVKLIWCNGLVWSYGWLMGVHLPWIYVLCAIPVRADKFGVAVFKASMLDWLGVHLPSVYMCIVLYVKLIWCNYLACSYGQFGGKSVMGICALCYIWNLFGVMVVQRSMFEWRRGKLMWCNGFVEIYAWLEGVNLT